MQQHTWTYDRPHGAVRYDIRSPLGTVYATSASEKLASELVEKLNRYEVYAEGFVDGFAAGIVADMSVEPYNSKPQP